MLEFLGQPEAKVPFLGQPEAKVQFLGQPEAKVISRNAHINGLRDMTCSQIWTSSVGI